MGFYLFLFDSFLPLAYNLMAFLSTSIQTAEQERLQRELGLKFLASGSSAHKPAEMEKLGKIDEPTRR